MGYHHNCLVERARPAKIEEARETHVNRSLINKQCNLQTSVSVVATGSKRKAIVPEMQQPKRGGITTGTNSGTKSISLVDWPYMKYRVSHTPSHYMQAQMLDASSDYNPNFHPSSYFNHIRNNQQHMILWYLPYPIWEDQVTRAWPEILDGWWGDLLDKKHCHSI